MKIISAAIITAIAEFFFAMCAAVLFVAMLSGSFDSAVQQQMDMAAEQAAICRGEQQP